jgi:hypothetical protein
MPNVIEDEGLELPVWFCRLRVAACGGRPRAGNDAAATGSRLIITEEDRTARPDSLCSSAAG